MKSVVNQRSSIYIWYIGKICSVKCFSYRFPQIFIVYPIISYKLKNVNKHLASLFRNLIILFINQYKAETLVQIFTYCLQKYNQKLGKHKCFKILSNGNIQNAIKLRILRQFLYGEDRSYL